MKKFQATASYTLIQAMMWGFYAILLCFTSNFLYEFGFQDSQISLVLGLATAASCALQLGIAELVSRNPKWRLYRVILVIAGVMAVCCCAMLTGFPPAAVGGLAVCCALLQAIPALGNSLGMDAIEKGSPTSYSLARGFGSLSYSILAWLTGSLVRSFGAKVLPVIALAGLVVLVIGVLWFHRAGEGGLSVQRKARKAAPAGGNFLKTYPRFAVFLLGSILLAVSHNLLTNFMFQIISAKGGGAAEQGIATSISALVELPVMFLFPLFLKKARCDQWVRFSTVFFLAKTLGLYFATTPYGVYAAQATQMLGYGLFVIATVSYASKAVGKDDVVRAQSYMASTAAIGALFATSTGGVICQWLGVQAMLLVSTAAAAVGGIIVLLSAEKTE